MDNPPPVDGVVVVKCHFILWYMLFMLLCSTGVLTYLRIESPRRATWSPDPKSTCLTMLAYCFLIVTPYPISEKSFFTFGNSCFACLPRLINPCYTNESWKQNVTFCLQIGTFGLKTNSRMKQPTKRSNTYSVTFSLAFRCRLIISACTCPAQHILRKRKERNQKSEISIPRRQMKVLLMQGLSWS